MEIRVCANDNGDALLDYLARREGSVLVINAMKYSSLVHDKDIIFETGRVVVGKLLNSAEYSVPRLVWIGNWDEVVCDEDAATRLAIVLLLSRGCLLEGSCVNSCRLQRALEDGVSCMHLLPVPRYVDIPQVQRPEVEENYVLPAERQRAAALLRRFSLLCEREVFRRLKREETQRELWRELRSIRHPAIRRRATAKARPMSSVVRSLRVLADYVLHDPLSTVQYRLESYLEDIRGSDWQLDQDFDTACDLIKKQTICPLLMILVGALAQAQNMRSPAVVVVDDAIVANTLSASLEQFSQTQAIAMPKRLVIVPILVWRVSRFAMPHLLIDCTSYSDNLPRRSAYKVIRIGPKQRREGSPRAAELQFLHGTLSIPESIQQIPRPSKVLIDARELRSRLPLAFVQAGFHVQVVTLKSADYVLSDIVAAERKAIETCDLVQSLDHGRLYNQLRLLQKSYPVPLLLLESAHDYCLPLVHEIPDFISRSSYHAKLAVLAMNFPSIPFVWSGSPSASVELLADIHLQATQLPNESAQGSADLPGFSPEDTILHVLEKIPGITPDNIDSVLDRVHSIRDLCSRPLDDLVPILGSTTNAHLLRNFFDNSTKATSV